MVAEATRDEQNEADGGDRAFPVCFWIDAWARRTEVDGSRTVGEDRELRRARHPLERLFNAASSCDKEAPFT